MLYQENMINKISNLDLKYHNNDTYSDSELITMIMYISATYFYDVIITYYLVFLYFGSKDIQYSNCDIMLLKQSVRRLLGEAG
jgi:hypothetical protein